jgi:hypothetical protein
MRRCLGGWLTKTVEPPVAIATQFPVPPSIGRHAPHVIPTINLDDQPRCRCVEVDDVPIKQHDLPPKLYAQFAPAQRLPKPRLRRRETLPIAPSVLLELELRCDIG